MTSVNSPLERNPRGYTLLLGYEPNLEVFSGFDLERHLTFTTGSPSVQIPYSTLRNALQHGFSFAKKANDEIAIGVRPDQFLHYCIHAKDLHESGSSGDIEHLEDVVEKRDIDASRWVDLPAERKLIISEVERLSRNAHFKKMVLQAYDHRCAVTGIQLRLVEAAHILPVVSEDSVDHVTNGLALSPTIHRAFDQCLIYLNENYKMCINRAKYKELKNQNLLGGWDSFSSYLEQRIYLPPDKNQYPDLGFIHRANQFRRVPGY